MARCGPWVTVRGETPVRPNEIESAMNVFGCPKHMRNERASEGNAHGGEGVCTNGLES